MNKWIDFACCAACVLGLIALGMTPLAIVIAVLYLALHFLGQWGKK